MTHYTDDQWLDFADEFVAAADRPHMEQHLATCGQCRSTYAQVEEFRSSLQHPDTWLVCDALVNTESAPPAWLQEQARRIDRDRIDAQKRLDSALISPAAFAVAAIEQHDEYYTSGTVELLTATARAVRYRQPPFAATLSAAATTIGTRLARDGALRSHVLLTYAWVERAAALFFCGRYRDAEHALDSAQATLDERNDGVAVDAAIIGLLRATICSETERPREAAALAAAAEKQFVEFGDERNAAGARLIQGTVAFFERDFVTAAAIYEELVSRARAGSDAVALANALGSAAGAYVKMSQYAKAEAYLLKVLPLWDELGSMVNRIRAEWVLGVSYAHQRRFDEAMPVLRRAIQELEAMGSANDGAVVRLYLAEALWFAGRNDEIPPVVEGVVVKLAAEGMSQRANYAIAFLRDALSVGRADGALIQHVRDYLDDLLSHRNAEFRPPQPAGEKNV
ncbi:MAG: hypothetical protein JO197_06640 [Acidobacteria bacterium]|nr:hypothetical protein [Acidobacteriota bacterium]MBV9477532.1 hypothetical protein [Acidobacteriota bacterium]